MATGLYLKAPHGILVSQGKKHSVVSAKFDSAIIGEHIIISKQDGKGLAFGTATIGEPSAISRDDFNSHFDSHRVTQSEVSRWWKDHTKLYVYPITDFTPFSPPRQVSIPAGTQMLMGEVKFTDECKVTQEDNPMPWKPSDAQSHTRAADTPEKQRQWAEIANSALARCMEGKEGDEARKKCEGSAIAQANSVIGKSKEMDERLATVKQLCDQLGVKVTIPSESDDQSDTSLMTQGIRSCQNDTNSDEKGTAEDNNLPDSAFLYVESGDKDKEGKTEPRSKRHLPYRTSSGSLDLPRLRNALSRLGQPNTGKGWLSADLRKRLIAKAERLLKGASKKELEAVKILLDEALKAAEPDQSTCTCPNCDAEVDHEEGTPCREVKCPDCGTMMRGGGDDADDTAEDDKANTAVEMLANMGTNAQLSVPEVSAVPAQSIPTESVPIPAPMPVPVSEAKVETTPVPEPVASPVPIPVPSTEPEHTAAFNLISLLSRAKSAIADFLGLAHPEADTLPAFKVLTSKSGKSYILLWTTNNYRDREREIFSLQSLKDYVTRKATDEAKGEFWYSHVNGAKFGTVTWQDVIADRFLVQVGPFDETPIGHAFQTFFEKYPDKHPIIAPHGWGASHGYHYIPEDRKDGIYDWFDTIESSVLPMHRAANVYNPQPIVLGGKQMDEKSTAELRAIGDEIGVNLLDLITKTAEQRKSELDATVDHKSAEVQPDAQPAPTPVSVESVLTPAPGSTEQKSEPEYPVEQAITESQLAILIPQIAKAFGMDSLSQEFKRVSDVLEKQQDEVASLRTELAELKQADEKRLEDKAQQLPNFESLSWLRPSQSPTTILTSADGKLRAAGPRVPVAIARLSEET